MQETLNDAQTQDFGQRIITFCKQHAIDTNDAQVAQLLAFLALLAKWNRAYNLTAIRQLDEMLSKHIFDSLSIIPSVKKIDKLERVIDVGTGAGLPGIVLALYFPDTQFTLVDSAGKKIRFLHQVVLELGLKNVKLANQRVESIQPDEPFDVVTSRAFASLNDMTRLTQHLLSESGIFLAMKGISPVQEIAEIEQDFDVLEQVSLDTPEIDGQRCLITLKKR